VREQLADTASVGLAFLLASVKETLVIAVRFASLKSPVSALHIQASIASRKPSLLTAATQHQPFATGTKQKC
jgi:hypothetical protein